MKYAASKLFSAIILFLLCQHPCPTFANADTTASIVFTSTRDGNKEIYVMNTNGNREINLTRNRADDLDPTWSPDGKRILFVSNREGVRDLYLMDADRDNVQRVFQRSAHREQPTWSPDGKRKKVCEMAASLVPYWRQTRFCRPQMARKSRRSAESR